jgi:hypothetical protein
MKKYSATRKYRNRGSRSATGKKAPASSLHSIDEATAELQLKRRNKPKIRRKTSRLKRWWMSIVNFFIKIWAYLVGLFKPTKDII